MEGAWHLPLLLLFLGVSCKIVMFCQRPLWVPLIANILIFIIGPVEILVDLSRVDPVERTYTYEYIYIIFCV